MTCFYENIKKCNQKAREPQKLPLWEAATSPRVGGVERGARPPVDPGTTLVCSVGSGATEVVPERDASSQETVPEAEMGGKALAFSFSSSCPSVSFFASHLKAGGKGTQKHGWQGVCHSCNSE